MAITNYLLKDGSTLEVTTVDKPVTYQETTTRIIPAPDPGTTTAFTTAIIPFSDTDLIAPGRGVEQWHNDNVVNVPVEGTDTQRLDVYFRFVWSRLEKSLGVYDWTFFDSFVNTAIRKIQKVHFGIMTAYPEGTERHGLVAYDGGYGCYPLDLHKQMQAESVKDWKKGSTWTPNYNSPAYLTRWATFLKALNQHIVDKDWLKVIGTIDIRGYGSWGEWNSSQVVSNTNEYPAGTFPTVESLKKIVDAHRDGFPDIQLQSMIAGFDALQLNVVNNPPEIAYYLLTQKNNVGLFGWRRDQWGATDDYLSRYLENNNVTFNGVVFKNLIMERWKVAPITGEPAPYSNDMADLERQVRLYHATSFGNGNYGVTPNTTVKERVRAASKASGYRLQITGGHITTGSNGNIAVNWENVGIAPTYEKWNIEFELRTGDNVVWTGKSSFKIRLFLPGSFTHIDSFPDIPIGIFTLAVTIVDPTGYRQPLVLANKGRNDDGSYTLKP